MLPESVLQILREAFHVPSSRAYRACETVVAALITLSVALLAIDIALPKAYTARHWLQQADRFILWLFAIELVLRVGSFRPPALEVRSLGPPARCWRMCWAGCATSSVRCCSSISSR